MLQSFRHKALKRLFESGDRRGVPPQFAAKIELVLDALDAATSLDDLNQPGFGLHPLTGNRKGEWAIVITRNWRITFEPLQAEGEFHAGNADYEDYH